ncbi:hypothetical protein [Halopseudomonas bauzanensis]|nr:hypothetical protein [Halopseudomonas bauzanensis]
MIDIYTDARLNATATVRASGMADMATTTLTDGRVVDFIVRQER